MSDEPSVAETQDWYEAALTDLARVLEIDPLPFITIRAYDEKGAVWGYAYAGAKGDLRAAVRAAIRARTKVVNDEP